MRLHGFPCCFPSLPLVRSELPRRMRSPSLLIHAHREKERLVGHVHEARVPRAERFGHMCAACPGAEAVVMRSVS